ncbi:MAG: hypothetical protein R3263_03715, partial [Myxococcota bacterium]|nr:hypothetical protein [Myxococcota bacterium]
MRDLRSPFLALLGLPLALALGCFGYANVTADRDDHPVVNHGAGATILGPGQGPAMPATPRPGGPSSPGAAPAPSPAPAPAGP